MKKMMISAALGLALLGLITPRQADATPTLSISDGSTTVTVVDNGVGDFNAVTGGVTFIGTIGNFLLNVSTGVTYPALGSPANPEMDLNSVDVTSASGGGTLTLKFSVVGFSSPLGFTAEIGGTIGAGGSLSYNTFLSSTNTLFAQTTPLTSLGSFGPGAFSDTTSGIAGGVGPFSLTQVVTLTLPNAGTGTSFDARLAVPEPASLLLLGAGLAGLGIWRRRSVQA
mgnify:CR=1 FL=1